MKYLSCALLLAGLWCSVASACVIAYPQPGEVYLADEEVIVVWDPVSRIEHFIRTAKFDANVDNFGFIVPTPSKPDLAEASEQPFEKLRAMLERWNFEARRRLPAGGLSRGKGTDSKVAVLEEKRVSGFDVAVLDASDSTALLGWLKKHGYEARPSFEGWLQPYLDAHWKITAFKYSKDSDGESIDTKPVRMSFATEKPFFPYREPADSARKEGPCIMRVFFFGPGPVDAELFLSGIKRPWRPGEGLHKDFYVGGLDARDLLAGVAPADPLQRPLWLSTFQDSSLKRMTGDVYFNSIRPEEVPAIFLYQE